jgi:heme/copper-type cytochrome/quinol oxidase subunit 2
MTFDGTIACYSASNDERSPIPLQLLFCLMLISLVMFVIVLLKFCVCKYCKRDEEGHNDLQSPKDPQSVVFF